MPSKATPQAGVSCLHEVPAESSMLADYLRELQLHRLQALFEERGQRREEWFGEYARSQLASDSACTSRPSWLAWRGCLPCSDGEGSSSVAVVALWAADLRAARRGVLALRLVQLSSTTHVLTSQSHVEQLERYAREQDNVEVIHSTLCRVDDLPDALTSPLRPYECWSTLLTQTGEALGRLRQRRRVELLTDDETARNKSRCVMLRLSNLDFLAATLGPAHSNPSETQPKQLWHVGLQCTNASPGVLRPRRPSVSLLCARVTCVQAGRNLAEAAREGSQIHPQCVAW